MVKKILIAVDDQAPDSCFVGKGIELANQLDAVIGLIDVARLSIGFVETGMYTVELEDYDRKRAVKTVEEIKQQFPGIKFTEFEEVGEPVEEINTIVNEWKPDLLVIGHHKHALLQRMFDNSKERRIINTLNIPVMVVPCG